ncbi:MAG: AMP-binding protein [Gemmatimonadota bacterium]|nr:AMP-binding protein [Gemmatimonadota bacterium]
MNIASALRLCGSQFGGRTALAWGTEAHSTYAEFAERVAFMAGGFIECLGLHTGDRVGIAMSNCPQFLEVLYSVWHAGCVAVPINAKLHPRELAYILQDSGARVCFTTLDLEDTVTPLQDSIPSLECVITVPSQSYEALNHSSLHPMADLPPDDLAWLFYTSGTTGRPKGAMLTHRNLLSMTLNYFSDVDTIEAGDAMIHAAPLSHGSGLYALPNIAKGAVHIIPESRGFRPEEIFQLIEEYEAVTFFAAPTMVKRLVGYAATHAVDLTNLKTIVYGGGPMYVEDLKHSINVLGNCLVQIYGQGESPMTITSMSKVQHVDPSDAWLEEHLASAGTPQTGVEVRVADENDVTLPTGEIGEVLVRGDVVMAGYYNNAEATATALKNGWLHTGDVGVMDENGFLTLKDRSNDLIISGGSNIYPREVEDALLQHEGVKEIAVIGKPHDDWGESVVAFVVPLAGMDVTVRSLDEICLQNIARFKRPREYHFIDALPKNNYGKIVKTQLSDLLS